VYISSPLTYVINRSLSTGIFPDRLKFSEIKPIYKKGEKNLISNYRPMSLLTSFSKIFEKVIYGRLIKHVVNNNILVNEQFGFRGTLQLIDLCIDYWTRFTIQKPILKCSMM
jgi:hypothetical protein